MIIEYFYSHKSSPLYLITRSATVAAMAESVSTWSMRTSKTDSAGRVAGPNTVSTRMIPDRPGPSRMRYGLSRTAPNPTRTAHDSPVSEAFMYQQSCIFVYFLF